MQCPHMTVQYLDKDDFFRLGEWSDGLSNKMIRRAYSPVPHFSTCKIATKHLNWNLKAPDDCILIIMKLEKQEDQQIFQESYKTSSV